MPDMMTDVRDTATSTKYYEQGRAAEEAGNRIEAIQASFREDPPTRIGDYEVTAFYDRRDVSGPFGEIRSGTDFGSRDVLVFELGEHGRLLLRPSGTEPKVRVMIEGRCPEQVPQLCAELATEVERILA